MKTIELFQFLEKSIPLRFQEDYDNSGLQIGHIGSNGCPDPSRECTGVLVCLDVTEEVISEAVRNDCNVIISHHPLFFKPLKRIGGFSYQERCAAISLSKGIAIYSAHTNLDNAPEGVNHKIAQKIGLEQTEWLESRSGEYGSGLIGHLAKEEKAGAFLEKIKKTFNAECLMHTSAEGKIVRKVAICGGAGGFLAKTAFEKGADCFITGEMSYHGWFDFSGMLLAAPGHYQSEQFTKELLRDIIVSGFPALRVRNCETETNPIEYL